MANGDKNKTQKPTDRKRSSDYLEYVEDRSRHPWSKDKRIDKSDRVEEGGTGDGGAEAKQQGTSDE